MIINKLELTNFRKHRKLEIDLKPGVTGIIGPNGSGKSSIIEALMFVLIGELYDGKKQDAITLGEDFGSVRMTFTLNGKKGILTRYLSQGNLQLSYGEGGPKKKAGDVKELWESLLQIGPEIISKVIIAKQGDIPLLFSGSSTIREKIFQKIFLVPNTEKVRSAIQTNYLKQLPPLLYAEDAKDLQTQLEASENKVNRLRFDLDELQLLSEDRLDRYKERIKFINKCLNDTGTALILMAGIADLEQQAQLLQTEVDELTDILASIKIEDYELQKTTQLQQKALYLQKLKLEEELIELGEITGYEEAYQHAKAELAELQAEQAELQEAALASKLKLNGIEQRLSRYKNLKGQSTCDCCGQPLHSVVALVEALNLEKEEEAAIFKLASSRSKTSTEWVAEKKKYVDGLEDMIKERKRVEKSLEQFKDLTFDEASLNMFIEVINQYKAYKEDLDHYKAQLNVKNQSLALQRQELKNLATYDGTYEDPNQEKEIIAQILQAQEQAYRQQQILQVDLKMKEMEITNIKQRQKVSKENLEKNKKRNRYSELLGIALDTLSTRQFPRKLIMNYAADVSEYLQEKLQGFNIPYTAKVGENFQIEMYDDKERKLPSVSGGQEIQVGISLHLALHELFSQSFPLLVIDEGTTHLDTANRKAYFDIIKKLKANEKLQQILIIDHDSQLSEVVDNVIELEPND